MSKYPLSNSAELAASGEAVNLKCSLDLSSLSVSRYNVKQMLGAQEALPAVTFYNQKGRNKKIFKVEEHADLGLIHMLVQHCLSSVESSWRFLSFFFFKTCQASVLFVRPHFGDIHDSRFATYMLKNALLNQIMKIK